MQLNIGDITGGIVLAAIYLLAPAAVMRLCRKVPALGKVGPVLILYILGIMLGNLWRPALMPEIQEILSSATVPFAIPLLLFGCTFRKGEIKNQALALISGLAAVIITVIAGYLIFGRGIPDAAEVGGMLTGVYTGGTVNLAAIKMMLGASEETFILLNSYDMAISFLYLTFLIAVGIRLFRKFLPYGGAETATVTSEHKEEMRRKVSFKEYFSRMWLPLLAAVLIIGVSAGIGSLVKGGFMTVFILLITALGIAASFYRPLRNNDLTEPTAIYFIYIFSIVVASMADLSKLDISAGVNLLGYLSLVVFGSLLLNVLFAKILHIDADTTVICSVSFICSPPFVPMMTAAMKNDRVLLIGLTAGIIGYAAGNYLGFIIYNLLKML